MPSLKAAILHSQIMNLRIRDNALEEMTSRESLAYKIGHRDARHDAAELALDHEDEAPNPAVAAIHYALSTDDGMTFLRLWNEGDFDSIREEWSDVPKEVFIGADPLDAKS